MIVVNNHNVADAVASTKKETVFRSFFVSDKNIYLTVRKGNNFSFAYVENGELSFTEMVNDSDYEICPQKLPIINGEVRPIVGVPDKSWMELVGPQNAEELFADIKQHLMKYLDASESEYELLSYYSLFTWFYTKVNTLPYLRFLGDTGKGKSRFLKVISDLCFYPIKASGASTASSAIRYNEQWHGTLVMDEADLEGGAQNPLIKYFNVGFEKHSSNFMKCKSSDYSELEFFDAFCPKVFAMREHFMDNATEGRILSIIPKETRRKDIPVVLPQRYETEVELLRARIANFVLFNWDNVDGNKLFDCRDFDVESRVKQILIPMSIVCQVLPQGEAMLKNYLILRQKEITKVRSQSFEGAAFNHVYSLAIGDAIPSPEFSNFFANPGVVAVTPKMAAEGLGASTRSITRALQSIGMMSESSRVELTSGDKPTTRYYAVPDEGRWEEIIQRYWIPNSEDETLDQFPECPEALKSKDYKEYAK